MMKKIFAGLLLSGIAICHVSGQTALEGNKFSDNWSIGINVGGVTPLTHHSFFKNMRSAVGVHVSKHLTPTFGLGFEAMGLVREKICDPDIAFREIAMDFGFSSPAHLTCYCKKLFGATPTELRNNYNKGNET